MKNIAVRLAFAIYVSSLALPCPAEAQDRLPEILRTNRAAAIGVYTCIIKLETYARLTASQPNAPYKINDAGYAAALSVGGVDFSVLRTEMLKDTEAWGTDVGRIRDMDLLIAAAAEKEFNEKAGQSWAHAASCGQAMGQLKLYEIFPIKPR